MLNAHSFTQYPMVRRWVHSLLSSSSSSSSSSYKHFNGAYSKDPFSKQKCSYSKEQISKTVPKEEFESVGKSISSELESIAHKVEVTQRKSKWDVVQYKKKKKKYPTLKDNIPLQPVGEVEPTLAYKNAKVLSQTALDMFQVEDRSTHYHIFPKGDPEWQKLTEAFLAPAELALEMKKKALQSLEIEEKEFFSLKHSERSRYNINDWNMLIRAQTAQNRFELAQETFEKIMNSKTVQPNVVTFTSMIHACALCAGPDAYKLAFDYLKRMKLLNIEPMIATYGALVHAFTNAKKLNEAFELIEAMRARDIQPNNVIHSTLLAACIKAGDLTRSWQHFELMISRYGINPDEVTLSIMMHAAAEAGQAEKALRIFKQFDLLLLTPTSVTYHTLMMALAKRKEYRWKVFETADQMELHGHKPSLYTFNILCYACAKDGNVEKIPKILEKMRAMDITPDTYTFNTLIQAYRVANIKKPPATHNQHITDAMAMFNLMQFDQVAINRHTLNSTLGVLASALRLNSAVEFFENKFKDHNTTHDAITYTIMINMFARAKRIEVAEEFFQRFRREHASEKPTYAMYKHIILGCLKTGLTENAKKWLHEMYSIDGYKFSPPDLILYQSTLYGADNIRRNNLERNKNIKENLDHFLKVF